MQQTIKTSSQEPLTSILLEEEPELFDLVARFVEHLPKRLSDISDATTDQNWDALKQQLHALKGVCINFGFPSISQLTQKIENTLSHQLYENITPLLEELNTLCQRINIGENDQRTSIMNR